MGEFSTWAYLDVGEVNLDLVDFGLGGVWTWASFGRGRELDVGEFERSERSVLNLTKLGAHSCLR